MMERRVNKGNKGKGEGDEGQTTTSIRDGIRKISRRAAKKESQHAGFFKKLCLAKKTKIDFL